MGSQRGNVLRHGIKKGATFWTWGAKGVISLSQTRAKSRGAAAAPSLAIPRAAMLSFSAPRPPVTERRGYSVFRGGPGSAAGEHGGRRCGQAHPVAPREARGRGRLHGRSPSTWTCRAVVLGDGSGRPFARERLGRGEPASIGLGLLGVLAARGGGHRRCRCGRRAACLASAACGGGCPFAFGAPPGAGDCVLDLGCGGGHNLAIASKLVGPSGTVFGIDLTQPMLDRTAATRREVRRPPAPLDSGELIYLHPRRPACVAAPHPGRCR